jgi:hypothetical protein
MSSGSKQAVAFLKKSSAKRLLFMLWRCRRDRDSLEESKVFLLLFFQKKQRFIPRVINKDRWYKPLFWREAAHQPQAVDII